GFPQLDPARGITFDVLLTSARDAPLTEQHHPNSLATIPYEGEIAYLRVDADELGAVCDAMSEAGAEGAALLSLARRCRRRRRALAALQLRQKRRQLLQTTQLQPYLIQAIASTYGELYKTG